MLPPPQQKIKYDTDIVTKLGESYKVWHGFLEHFTKPSRVTLGNKIDNLFTDCLELALYAGFTKGEAKLPLIKKLSSKFDALKFFLKIMWEVKALDQKKYEHLSLSLAQIGKEIGGWIKLFEKETLPNSPAQAGKSGRQ